MLADITSVVVHAKTPIAIPPPPRIPLSLKTLNRDGVRPFPLPFLPSLILSTQPTVNAERAAAEVVVQTVAEAAPLIGTAQPERRTFPSISPFSPSSPFSDSDKKLHNGWGGDDGNAELKAEEAATFDAAAESGGINDWAPTADTSAGDWGAPPQDPAPEHSPDVEKPDSARRKDRDPEEEDNTLTLEQYLAQQKGDPVLLPKLETRKANDGAQDDIFDGAVRLEKGHGEAYFSGKVPTPHIPPVPFLTPLIRQSLLQRHAQRKRKKSSSRSMPTLNVLPAVVVDVVVTEERAEAVAVVVVAVGDAVPPMAPQPTPSLSMSVSMTKPLSLLSRRQNAPDNL